ncbi:hypothetical protein BVI434_790009 [Burkholderia vietnamiensis]|nr:hypothetical protein BVI434_790009 [Burkholderia vietnamiensis]
MGNRLRAVYPRGFGTNVRFRFVGIGMPMAKKASTQLNSLNCVLRHFTKFDASDVGKELSYGAQDLVIHNLPVAHELGGSLRNEVPIVNQLSVASHATGKKYKRR